MATLEAKIDKVYGILESKVDRMIEKADSPSFGPVWTILTRLMAVMKAATLSNRIDGTLV